MTIQGIFNGSRLFPIDLCVVPENIHIQPVEGLWKFGGKGALESHKLACVASVPRRAEHEKSFFASGRAKNRARAQGRLDIFWTVTHIKSSPDNNFVAYQVKTLKLIMLIFIPRIINLLFIRISIDTASGFFLMIKGLTLLYHL